VTDADGGARPAAEVGSSGTGKKQKRKRDIRNTSGELGIARCRCNGNNLTS